VLTDYRPLLACLLAAHFLADFVLQSDRTAETKSKILVLLRHAFIVSAVSYLLSGAWAAWVIPLAVFLGHGVLDFCKSRIKGRPLAVFLIDQTAHIGFLIALSIWVVRRSSPGLYWTSLFGDTWTRMMIIGACATAAIYAGGVLIGIAVSPLLKEIAGENTISMPGAASLLRGLDKGGKLIGQLERAIIFLLVLAGHPEGVGFLIAAKSILRFGEIKDAKQRQEAEYIIIGTFMSFGYGLFIAFLTKYLLNF
jgi:hypothetical protein